MFSHCLVTRKRVILRQFFSFWISLFFVFSAVAQAPTADFTANNTSGCATLSVSFTDKSTGNPRFWTWDFGNGQLSNLQNPSTSYSIPGFYTVKLVVRNEVGADIATKTNYIEVFPSPQIGFTVDKRLICKPATVQFTDLSTYTAGTILTREWNFGDGSPVSNAINPTHTYDSIGYFNVSLKITTNTGCNAATTSFRYIRVVPGIKTDFINLPTLNCNAPFSVSFKNQSAGPGTISYLWDFGNGLTSTAKDPTTSYPAATSYTVKLTTQSDFGCSGSVQKVINLSTTVTDFTAPVNACPNAAITFTNSSSVVPVSSTWFFSDGVQIQQINATRSFPAAGSYTVKMVNRYPDCTDSVTKNITIIPVPVISFAADKTISCKAPFTVNFTDNSPDGNQWQWDFGDGTLGNGKTIQHTYSREGIFNVTLNLQTSTGCVGSQTQSAMIRIVRPELKVNNLPAGGCAPYGFSPQSIVNSIDGIQSYAWDFGDGGTGTGPTPTHTYLTTGKFTLKLTVTTNGGCTETITIPNAVKVGTPPVVDFTTVPPPPLSVCAADSVQFSNPSAPADEFIWRFGDGSDTSMQKNPKHKFIAGGNVPVTLVAINNGCADSLTKNIINIKPPVAKFDYTVRCASSGGIQVDFTNESTLDPNPGVTTTYQWEWNTGNGFSTSPGPLVSYTYPSGGIYTARLIVSSNNGCRPDTFSRKINLITEKASFTINDNAVCRNQPFVLTATNTNPGKVKTYTWKIGNVITYSNDTLNKLDTFIAVRGIYPVELAIVDTNGCRDSLSITGYLKVLAPAVDFSAVGNGGCVNSLITFADASTSIAPIRKWTFDFGDNQTKTFTAPPFNHTYAQTGIYNIRLIAEDTAGCADTLLKPFATKITRPDANFGTEFTSYCAARDLQFVDSSSGGVNFNYTWDLGDGTISNSSNPVHQYAARATPYTVKMKITDEVGCSDSITRINYITISTPKAAFTARDTVAICPPLETKFTFAGSGYASFFWALGDGTDTLDIKDPSYFYNSYGNFVAKLVVTGNGGCYDSATRNIYVYDPYTTVSIGYPPTRVCNEALIDFNVTTPPNTSFVFFYGDGTGDSTQQKSLSHLYNYPGFYTPIVQLRDNFACQVDVGGPTRIEVLGAIPVFSASDKNFCDSGTVFFNNFTLTNDPPVSYLWDFKDGATSNVFEPIHQYTSPGLYPVTLTATTQNNCAKTFSDTIRVFRTPQPSFTNTDTICVNSPVFFTGTLAQPDTAIKWNWVVSDGRTSNKPDAVFAFTTPGPYTIRLTTENSFGCKDSVSKSLDVKPVPQITIPASIPILVGSGINLPVTYSSNVITYLWSPATNLSCTNCAIPFANPKFTTTYRIRATDDNGCVSSKDVRVEVLCNDKNFFIPNTFSPNNDGVNDRFFPRGTGIDRIRAIRIFNRWGELVYEKRDFAANDQNAGWDGTQRGKAAASDTYVYMIDIVCENAAIITFKGNVTLIR
jgi:gliding motility-associated-like protein